MGWDAPWHWIVLIGLVIVLFGYKKLPDASRSLGRSLRIFKTEIKGMGEDDKAREAAATSAVEAAPVAAPAVETSQPAAAPAAAPTAPATPAAQSSTVPPAE